MNIIEKHLAKAADLEKVSVGEDIRCKVRLVVAHDVTGPMAVEQFAKIKIEEVFDPQRVVMVIDHIYPASTVQARNMHWILKDFTKRYGTILYEHGQGVVHQIISENHAQNYGDIIIGADSHTCTAGGYGVIGIGVGSTEVAAAMATGTIDLEVPEVVEVNLTGSFKPFVTAKDLVLTLIGRFGTDGLTDKAILFTGPGVRGLSKDERMTVSNMGIEMGAMISFFADEDKDEGVAQTVAIELSEIIPVVACPYSPANIKPVQEVAGTEVTQVVAGSCTNGRLSDMKAIAEVLRGKHIHPDVNMIVIPASARVYEEMEKHDYCKVIRDAGAVLLNPGCGPCFGAHQGLAADRDVVVSTTNRNFPGRMGSREAKIYLASPVTAAKAAVHGRFVDPREPSGGGEN